MLNLNFCGFKRTPFERSSLNYDLPILRERENILVVIRDPRMKAKHFTVIIFCKEVEETVNLK